jgi:hypothetical protein
LRLHRWLLHRYGSEGCFPLQACIVLGEPEKDPELLAKDINSRGGEWQTGGTGCYDTQGDVTKAVQLATS